MISVPQRNQRKGNNRFLQQAGLLHWGGICLAKGSPLCKRRNKQKAVIWLAQGLMLQFIFLTQVGWESGVLIHSHSDHMKKRTHDGTHRTSRGRTRKDNRQPNCGPSHPHPCCNHLVTPEFVADSPLTPDYCP